jgi:hypothetical protein
MTTDATNEKWALEAKEKLTAKPFIPPFRNSENKWTDTDLQEFAEWFRENVIKESTTNNYYLNINHRCEVMSIDKIQLEWEIETGRTYSNRCNVKEEPDEFYQV